MRLEKALAVLGWAWDEPAKEWRLNDLGDGYDAVAGSVTEILLFESEQIEPGLAVELCALRGDATPASESRPYHVLLERDDTGKPWRVQFGDYDRETVEDERRDTQDNGVPRHCLKIITTGEGQADIDASVAALNEKPAPRSLSAAATPPELVNGYDAPAQSGGHPLWAMADRVADAIEDGLELYSDWRDPAESVRYGVGLPEARGITVWRGSR